MDVVAFATRTDFQNPSKSPVNILVAIDNDPLAYAWGIPGGISRLLGRRAFADSRTAGASDASDASDTFGPSSAPAATGAFGPSSAPAASGASETPDASNTPGVSEPPDASGASAPPDASDAPGVPPAPEAELWLGAHEASPSRAAEAGVPWQNLREWEAAHAPLPYLMKVLAAASPLSLQAHPNGDAARAGFEREAAAGVALSDPRRNYRDPYGKPELVIAVEDGFEALCGFRSVDETIAELNRIGAAWEPVARGLQDLADRLIDTGIRGALSWVLDAGSDVRALVRRLEGCAADDQDQFPLITALAAHHPGDVGILGALLLNHVRLAAGDCLWLPAGTVHSYVRGICIEVMGPSDNVLRGGLTVKHVDVPELLRILDIDPHAPEHVAPRALGDGAREYRPADLPSGAEAGFEVVHVTDDAEVTVDAGAIVAVLDGEFEMRAETGGQSEERDAGRGCFLFVAEAADLRFRGRGSAFIARATR